MSILGISTRLFLAGLHGILFLVLCATPAGLASMFHQNSSAKTVETEADWDGPLMLVESGKIILPLECRPGAAVKWTPEVLRYTYGLQKGDVVLALTTRARSEAVLGNISCFAGECGGNYVSIELQTSAVESSDVVGVSIKSFLEETADLRVPDVVDASGFPDCSTLHASMSNSYFPELGEEKGCRLLELQREPPRTFLQIASKAFMQENGWPIRMVHARVLLDDHGRVRPMEGVEVDYDTSALGPSLIVDDGHGDLRLLWSKAFGICCPAELTLRMSRIDAGGVLSFGRPFTAGGQPCD